MLAIDKQSIEYQLSLLSDKMRSLLSCRTVAARAALGRGKLFNLDQWQVCHFTDDHLGYPVAVLYLKSGIRAEEVHGNQYLTTVVAVYGPEGDPHAFR